MLLNRSREKNKRRTNKSNKEKSLKKKRETPQVGAYELGKKQKLGNRWKGERGADPAIQNDGESDKNVQMYMERWKGREETREEKKMHLLNSECRGGGGGTFLRGGKAWRRIEEAYQRVTLSFTWQWLYGKLLIHLL